MNSESLTVKSLTGLPLWSINLALTVTFSVIGVYSNVYVGVSSPNFSIVGGGVTKL